MKNYIEFSNVEREQLYLKTKSLWLLRLMFTVFLNELNKQGDDEEIPLRALLLMQWPMADALFDAP